MQQPHPPIWIGASGEKRMMPIAARYADVWHCFGAARAARAEVGNGSSAMAEAAGRDPAEITRAASLSLEDDARHHRPPASTTWDAAGFEYLVCGWPAGGREQVEAFASSHL